MADHQDAPTPGAGTQTDTDTNTAALADVERLDVLDPDALGSLSYAKKPAVQLELVELYQEESATQMAALRKGIAAQAADDVRRAAHGLRGDSATLGARQVQAICTEIEQLARTGNLAGVEALLAALDAANERLGERLRALRERLAASA